MAPKQAGMVWYQDQWRYFTEWQAMKAWKGQERVKVKLGGKFITVAAEDVKRYPEGGDHAQR